MPAALIAKALAEQWKIASTPTAFILDSGGTIRSVIVPTDPKQLAPALDRALRRTD